MKLEPGKSADRFDLEQQIHQVWHTQEDIDLICHNLDIMSEDELANSLIGLEQIFKMRMERLLKYFEECVKTGEI